MAGDNTSFRQGVLVGVLLSPLRLTVGLCLGMAALLVAAWVIDWIMVMKVWPDGVADLKALLADDVASGIALAALQGGSADQITGPANALYGWVFEMSGVHEMGWRFADKSALAIPDTIARQAFLGGREWIETAMVATQLIGVRLAILVRVVPLMLLVYGIGMMDGLASRSIRRCGGGAESASLYHRAKYGQLVVLGLWGLALLLWPTAVRWSPCLGAGVLAVGALACLQWRFYKKHE